MLRLKQVAEALNCSLSNVYALKDTGLLPVVRTGASKGFRVRPEDLEAFLDKRKQGRRETALRSTPHPRLKHLRF